MCSQEFSTARPAETESKSTCSVCGGSGRVGSALGAQAHLCLPCVGTGLSVDPGMLSPESAHGHTHDDPIFNADCSACLGMHAGVFTAQTNAVGCVRVIADRDATIAAQGEEIARLRAEAEANEAGCTHNFNRSQQRRVEIELLKGDVEELTLQRNAAIEARDTALKAVSAAVRERDSHTETIVQLAADLKRATDELDELRTNNAALGHQAVEALGKASRLERERDARQHTIDSCAVALDTYLPDDGSVLLGIQKLRMLFDHSRSAYKSGTKELQTIYTLVRPFVAQGKTTATEIFAGLIDENAKLRVDLNAAVRAREILDEERTTTGIRAVEVAAENARLRVELYEAKAEALRFGAIANSRYREARDIERSLEGHRHALAAALTLVSAEQTRFDAAEALTDRMKRLSGEFAEFRPLSPLRSVDQVQEVPSL